MFYKHVFEQSNCNHNFLCFLDASHGKISFSVSRAHQLYGKRQWRASRAMEKTLQHKAKVLEELNRQLAVKYESRSLVSRHLDALEYRILRLEEDMLQLSKQILHLEACHNCEHDLSLSLEPPSIEQKNVSSTSSKISG